jgi:hemerythrin-like domain-containing protein
MAEALRTIEDEHRSLAAVLGALSTVVHEVLEERLTADPVLIEAMVGYIRDFPERLHHPKEEDHLFRLLRERAPELTPVLNGLGEEHVRGAALLARLSEALRGHRAGLLPFAAFAEAVRAYAELEFSHMRREEQDVLPTAAQVFTDHDWESVDAAFRANPDPLSGLDPRCELREVFRRITALTPAPIGLGPPARRGQGGG